MTATRSGRRADSVTSAHSKFNAAFAWPIQAGRSRLSKRLGGEIGPREMAQIIFSLKQLGWFDRGEQTLKGARDAPVKIIVSEKMAT